MLLIMQLPETSFVVLFDYFATCINHLIGVYTASLAESWLDFYVKQNKTKQKIIK